MQIKIEQFEGPLGLLLKIIEKEELDITEISLANIADQYVEYIKTTDKINPDEMADFLVLAAKLLFIKSKALLPFLFAEEEEEIEELEEHLKMYKEFLEASKKIEKIIGNKKFMFAREFNRKAMLTNANVFSPPKNLEKKDLQNTFQDLIERVRPVEEKLEEKKMEKKVNISEKIVQIQKMILDKIKFNFSKVVKDSENKTEVIVSFLAMLELIKQREATAEQGELFEDIFVSKI